MKAQREGEEAYLSDACDATAVTGAETTGARYISASRAGRINEIVLADIYLYTIKYRRLCMIMGGGIS